MGKLAARIADLERKQAASQPPWWHGRSIEDTKRAVAEALRRGEEEDALEGKMPLRERLALRRQELAELDAEAMRPAPPGMQATLRLLDVDARNLLTDQINRLERQIAEEHTAPVERESDESAA